MHNWWIAALEHAGIWTREQAEHVSDEVKNSLHRERYAEAYEELGSILAKGNFSGLPTVSKLETDVSYLLQEIEKLKDLPKDTVSALDELRRDIGSVKLQVPKDSTKKSQEKVLH